MASPDTSLPVVDGLPRRLAIGWLLLGLCALGISSLFAVLLVMLRTPYLRDLFHRRELFPATLVLHVDLAVLVWFLSLAGVLWSLLGDTRLPRLGWTALGFSVTGALGMVAALLLGAGHPLMSNYIPVLDGPVFLTGLGLFAAGSALMVLRTLVLGPGLMTSAHRGGVLRFGAYCAAIAVAMAMFTLIIAYHGLPDVKTGREYFGRLFWGGGHLFQFADTLLMLVTWLVLVGDVGLDLQRADIYVKELDFRVSTSYGPGRYDPAYEQDGLDYPIGYVRWTENRNMAAYVDLLAAGRVDVAPLISKTWSLDNAPHAFASLDSTDRPLIALLSYPSDPTPPRRRIDLVVNKAAAGDRLRLAVAGAGNFVRNLHLPNLEKLGDLYRLRAVMSRTGHNATATAKQFSADYATTDYDELLADDEVDAILIGAPHDVHGDMTLRALQAGKHVLVEKPLALTQSELDAIADFYEGLGEQNAPLLLTGFNRRFSPAAGKIAKALTGRGNPAILNYRMNAGHIPSDNWVHGPTGGGRNIGEACHIYDLFTYLTGSRIVDVSARAIRPKTDFYRADDNFVATLTFDCGSVASLTYTALGDKSHPKEQLDVFCDGQVLQIDDYGADKGHLAERRAFAEAIRGGGAWPIPFWQQQQAMQIAFAVETQI